LTNPKKGSVEKAESITISKSILTALAVMTHPPVDAQAGLFVVVELGTSVGSEGALVDGLLGFEDIVGVTITVGRVENDGDAERGGRVENVGSAEVAVAPAF